MKFLQKKSISYQLNPALSIPLQIKSRFTKTTLPLENLCKTNPGFTFLTLNSIILYKLVKELYLLIYLNKQGVTASNIWTHETTQANLFS